MTEKWEAYYHNERHWVVHTDTALIADCFSGPDSKRNAHLIAAAPEMYEVLRVFADEPSEAEGRIYELCLAWHEARKLIDRIDGEEDGHD